MLCMHTSQPESDCISPPPAGHRIKQAYDNKKSRSLLNGLSHYGWKYYSTITIPFAITFTSFCGSLIASISSFDFLASSA